MSTTRKTPAVAGVIAALAFTVAACSSSPATQKDQAATNTMLDRYQKNQPAPQSDWSQYRQTVIDVELAQIHGVATTTFFFNLGTDRPIKVCSSIGFPVATTAQLTNPEQVVWNSQASGVVGQMEPNGVYTGDSSGTYVVCVAPGGTKYVSYWEGHVQTEGGPAHWDNVQGMIVLDGPPTVVAKTK